MTTDTRNTSPEYGIAPPGYRLPDAAHPGRVKLQVADLERSLAYYQRVLGMGVMEQSAGRATLGPQGGAGLVELVEKPGARPVSERGLLGLYHFAILLPDRPALGRLLQHLADEGEYAGTSDHFVSEALYLTDPDGLGIEVYVDRPRDTWRHRDRQLVMHTEPLDTGDVLAAAVGQPWTGMPRGTMMGHVHLFVSDLARAEAFYHRGVGFDKMVWSYPGALFMSAGGYHHHLGTNTWATGARPAAGDDARLLEWTMLLPDLHDAEAAARSVEHAGFRARREGDGWIVTDPWGTSMRLASESST